MIFVVDSNDRERISEASEELIRVSCECPEETIILILANKQDLSGAMSVEEISTKLNVNSSIPQNRVWRLFGCSAITGEGLQEALHWIHEQFNQDRNSKEDP